MIKKITIENFQSHEHTVVDLSGGLNLIVGSSNAGKTAILRAIKWVVYNRPLGNSIVSGFAKKPTRVVIETDDGHVVEKYKTKSETKYIVDGTELKAVGASVPKEVTEALKLTDINFQFQHDNYFLLSESPTNRTKIINDLTGLSAADSCIQISKKLISDKKKELKLLDSQKLSLEEDIEAVDDLLERAQPLVDEYESLEKELNEIEVSIDTVSQLVNTALPIELKINKLNRYSKVQRQLNKYQRLSDKFVELVALIDKLRLFVQLKQKHSNLNKYIKLQSVIKKYEQISEKYNEISDNIIKLNQIIRNTDKINKELEKLNKMNRIVRKLNRYTKLSNRYNEIDDIAYNLESVVDKLLSVRRTTRALKQTIKQMEDKFYEESGGVCPVCGQPLPKGGLHAH